MQFIKDDLQYWLIEYDGRLVIEIANPTSGSIELTGGSATDPNGVSHPIPSETISPGGEIKEIVPPIHPAADSPTEVNSQPPQVGPVDQPGYVLPRGYNQSEPGGKGDQSPIYWEWNGSGDVQIHLNYNAGGKMLEHDFTFHRAKK